MQNGDHRLRGLLPESVHVPLPADMGQEVDRDNATNGSHVFQ